MIPSLKAQDISFETFLLCHKTFLRFTQGVVYVHWFHVSVLYFRCPLQLGMVSLQAYSADCCRVSCHILNDKISTSNI